MALVPGLRLAARFWTIALAIGCVLPLLATADQPKSAGNAAFASRVENLIEQLGGDDFGQREKAQSELAQAGLEAYDALHAAQTHHDPEIALRARYLVRSMSVRWFSDSDSPKVVTILRDYGELQEADRRSRIDRLAALEDGLGLAPLVRLARFETMDPLAKYAALQVMQAKPEDAVKADVPKQIQAVAATSNRVAAGWLRLFARTLAEPLATPAEWDKTVQAEHELFAKNPERSSREVVRDLYRYQVELLKRLDQLGDARQVMRRMFALVDGTPEQVQELVDWLRFKEEWAVALELLDAHDAVVTERAGLLYRLAHIHDMLGAADRADATAQRALAVKRENIDNYLETGERLEKTRGLEKWAEGEYRQLLASAAAGSRQEFAARFKLAELLHDGLRELPAAEMLQPVCELITKDEAGKENWYRATTLSPDVAIARMNYFFACHYHEQRDYAQERKHLQLAVNAYPEDADVLIAMYRLPEGDAAWQAMTKEKIEASAAEFRREVENSRDAIEAADNEHSRADAMRLHAINCNQFAWLVGNTIGDHQSALKLSQESVEICQQLPEMKESYAGYLDTLGRCYYAVNDLPNAVKHQRLAAELNPFSGQIRRQLETFLKAAAERGVAVPAKG
jgi:tetratricopeptide (TPR) repeat protein